MEMEMDISEGVMEMDISEGVMEREVRWGKEVRLTCGRKGEVEGDEVLMLTDNPEKLQL